MLNICTPKKVRVCINTRLDSCGVSKTEKHTAQNGSKTLEVESYRFISV